MTEFDIDLRVKCLLFALDTCQINLIQARPFVQCANDVALLCLDSLEM